MKWLLTLLIQRSMLCHEVWIFPRSRRSSAGGGGGLCIQAIAFLPNPQHPNGSRLEDSMGISCFSCVNLGKLLQIEDQEAWSSRDRKVLSRSRFQSSGSVYSAGSALALTFSGPVSPVWGVMWGQEPRPEHPTPSRWKPLLTVVPK